MGHWVLGGLREAWLAIAECLLPVWEAVVDGDHLGHPCETELFSGFD